VKPGMLSLCLVVILYVGPADSQKDLPETPGKLEIAKHPLVLEPPIGPQAQRLDPSKLRQEAAELSQLAQSVPSDIDQVSQGKLPKDLSGKLKRVEKLSKQLRAELSLVK
jgi:hypothetical protein